MRNTFGIDTAKLTDLEIEREIAIHQQTIDMQQVGTPNVYVRLADLRREKEKRSAQQTCGDILCSCIRVPGHQGEHQCSCGATWSNDGLVPREVTRKHA